LMELLAPVFIPPARMDSNCFALALSLAKNGVTVFSRHEA
jgi:hypothetical protein